MAQSEDIQELIKELRRLNVRQEEIIRKLSDSTDAADNNTQNKKRNLAVGDKVTFKATGVTRGGSGTIVRFTATRAVIRKSNGAEVLRAPHNIRIDQSQSK